MKNKDLELLAKNIKKLRKANGYTQKEVTKAINLSPSYISKIENARVFSR